MVNRGSIGPARRFLQERRLKSLKAVCLTTNLCVFILILILILIDVGFTVVYNFKRGDYLAAKFYGKLVSDYYRALDGVIPKFRWQEGRVQPATSHTKKGLPIAFYKTVLLLLSRHSYFKVTVNGVDVDGDFGTHEIVVKIAFFTGCVTNATDEVLDGE